MNTIGKKNFPYPFVLAAIFVVLVGVSILIFKGRLSISFLAGDAALSVQTLHNPAKIFLDGKEVGDTPLRLDNVTAKKHTIKLTGDNNQYETNLDFLPRTEVAINRDLGVSDVFSSGRNFWMDKDKSGTVLSVISEPANATVYIDNTEVGKTPFSDSALSGGDYDLKISYPGYEVQNARINISPDYRLNVSFDLFPLPVGSEVKEFEESDGLYNVLSDNMSVVSDTQAWVKAILYWNETRGINLSGVGVNKERVFDYFIDYMGSIFDGDGNKMGDDLTGMGELEKGVYLARATDPEGLTAPAREAYLKITGSSLVVSSGKKATILETGTGWLRVRSLAGLDGEEVAKATVGETYDVMEEGTGWVRIKIDETTDGWVSADYVELSE